MTMTQLFEKLQQQNGVLFIMVASRKSNFFSDLLISIQWNEGHVGVPSHSSYVNASFCFITFA